MRLTTKGRYAVTAILDLALYSQKGPITLTEIAARQIISLSYLEQLFSRLRNARIVRGMRGPGGGYQLQKDPKNITIADIIEAVNEPIDSTKCRGEGNCQQDNICLTHNLWVGLSEHIHDYLEQITVEDLLLKRNIGFFTKKQYHEHDVKLIHHKKKSSAGIIFDKII